MTPDRHLPDSDQGSDFGLIETLLWTPENGFALLPEHLARLAASSAALGFRHDEEKVLAALAEIVSGLSPNAATASPLPRSGGGTGRGPFNPELAGADVPPPQPSPASREREQIVALPQRLRVRLVLSRDGSIETSATPIDPIPPETIWRVALAERRFSSADPLLRHKTTRRALYEESLAEAVKRHGADEVLFLNERDELCESARCSLFVPSGDILLTPPLSSGLLAGTLRASLIAEGRAREAVLRLDDLGDEFYLGNSVRGLVRANRLAFP
ncbi:aminotransferase class IV [Methylocystis iwaonis]|uniref:aminotransferase class IV n=1 Tax=Methylocystis iwaonis TaxID=2885079 RepID=UPI002E7AE95A|nr:aminotransferase class IV [Methylocystis iwaonis]